jgi:sulfate adenylyltransferase subunit 1
MVTGASTADLIIILVDARNGVVEQTRRHSIIASLLNIPHVIVAVNKMDLVGYSQNIFNNIVIDYDKVARSLQLKDVTYIPISALTGENIVEKSVSLDWYEGEALLDRLENIQVQQDVNLTHARFPVQYVIRPQTPDLHDYRGYAGKIISGIYRKGDKVVIQPSGIESTISFIEKDGNEVDEAFAPQSVILHLEDDVDISRGDLIVHTDNQPTTGQELEVFICWMDSKPLKTGNKYSLQLNSRRVRCMLQSIEYKLNVNTLQQEDANKTAALNDVIRATLKTASPIAYDAYKTLRVNGGAILVDETSYVTVAAVMIL